MGQAKSASSRPQTADAHLNNVTSIPSQQGKDYICNSAYSLLRNKGALTTVSEVYSYELFVEQSRLHQVC